MSTEIATQIALIPEIKNPSEIFVAGGLDQLIASVTEKAEALVAGLDISTERGRKAIASAARKVASSKTAIDEAGKSLKAQLMEQVSPIDEERRRMRDALDAVKDRIRKPLTDWEEADKRRIAEHEAAIEEMSSITRFEATYNAHTKQYEGDFASKDIEAALVKLDPFKVRRWDEFADKALKIHGNLVHFLGEKLKFAKKAEAERAELERLRAEEAERRQRERDERLQAEAAERARVAAESKTKREAEEVAAKAKAEQEREQRERASAEAKAQKAIAEAEERSRQLERAKQAAEQAAIKAEQEQRAAALRAEAARVEREERAKRDEEAAVQRERDRVKAQREADRAVEAKREADKVHRMEIENQAIEALRELMIHSSFGADSDEASAFAIEAIAKGQIPNVKITY